MIYAYIRVSTEAQSGASQEFEIRNWAAARGVAVDRWVKESVSGTVAVRKRHLGPLLRRMKKNDLLVCTEISRLGRSMLIVMAVLNECAQKGIRVQTIKDRFDLSNDINSKIIAFAFALASEIERNLISQRTREALADKKAQGVVLGRPVGSSRKWAAVVADREIIEEMARRGEGVGHIAKAYKVHRNTMRRYLKKMEIKSF